MASKLQGCEITVWVAIIALEVPYLEGTRTRRGNQRQWHEARLPIAQLVDLGGRTGRDYDLESVTLDNIIIPGTRMP